MGQWKRVLGYSVADRNVWLVDVHKCKDGSYESLLVAFDINDIPSAVAIPVVDFDTSSTKPAGGFRDRPMLAVTVDGYGVVGVMVIPDVSTFTPVSYVPFVA